LNLCFTCSCSASRHAVTWFRSLHSDAAVQDMFLLTRQDFRHVFFSLFMDLFGEYLVLTL